MIRSSLIAFIRFLAFPLFIILHLTFSISSLLLRTYQALTTSQSVVHEYEPIPDNGALVNPNDHSRPPKHLGLVLVPLRSGSGGGGSRRGVGRGVGSGKREKDALVESVLRAVEWGGERGIKEISIWDGQGGSALPPYH